MEKCEEQAKQTTPKQHKLDTADFLAFSDSPQPDFCPTDSSSPLKHWKPTRKNNSDNRNNRNFSGNNRNNSFNSPESAHSRSFSGPYEYYQNKRFESPTQSLIAGFKKSRCGFSYSFEDCWSQNDRSFNTPKNKKNDVNSIEDYLHPSFMENPWAELERKLMKEEHSCIDPQMLRELSASPNNSLAVET